MSLAGVNDAILMLADGMIYRGRSYGIVGVATGEICFNTGMTGYQEIFTDPSYFGQIMVTTNAHIGNYGVSDEEIESNNIQINGLVCKNFTYNYSRILASEDIKSYFTNRGKVVIADLDTRSIVRYIRSKGAMNAIISSDPDLSIEELRRQLSLVPSMDGLELSSVVSTKEAYELKSTDAKFKVAVLDYGVKKNILRCFLERKCSVKVFPAKTSFEEIEAWSPDGYFISNGPGDPASMDYAVGFTKKVLTKEKPLFGICLGHQILALALDVPTYKMHHGHRGINHPVKNLLSGRCEITSQNHGFGVSPDALAQRSDDIEITHVNLNDGTIEGIRHKRLPAFSVQYHPESSPGPHDSRYLFNNFVELIKEKKK